MRLFGMPALGLSCQARNRCSLINPALTLLNFFGIVADVSATSEKSIARVQENCGSGGAESEVLVVGST